MSPETRRNEAVVTVPGDPQIPDEAIEAAAQAEFDFDWGGGFLRIDYQGVARRALAAAFSVLEASIRARIADEIEAEGRSAVLFMATDTPTGLGRLIGAEDAYKNAIRIARGRETA